MLPDAIALIDPHYNSLLPYRPNRPDLYAVRQGAHLTLRYVEFLSGRLVLRPYNIAFPVENRARSERIAQQPAGGADRVDFE